jgi:Methylase involved in ubiquinone/menaquinone biosynthesis
LAGGTYAPLAEQISALVAEYAASAPCILDAGSGSGYYDKVLSETIKDAKIYGVDLSKEAVKLAAKHNKTAFYAVASVYDLPFSDETFDVVLCIFSPHAFSEYRRVLKRGGVLIVAYPDREHLFELKKLLYGDATYENEKQLYTEEFSLSKSCRIKFSADISCGALKTLLRMTPYYYTTEKTALLRVENIYGLSITFDFKIDVFIRE